MEEGAFALIDCLGWKGIWNRKIDSEGTRIDPLNILKKIQRIEDNIAKSTSLLKYGFSASPIQVTFKPRIVFLSDTVAVSVPPIKHKDKNLTKEIKQALSIEMACLTVAEIVDSFVEEEPYLTMRGCITYGEHLIRRNTFVGPAVDEAANNYEMPMGAFVWIHPKASEKLDDLQQWKTAQLEKTKVKAKQELDEEAYNRLMSFFSTTMDTPVVLRDYEMPIKGGGNLMCHVINPLSVIREAEQRVVTIERYRSSFDKDSVDILLKKQNTMTLLAESANAALEFYEQQFDFELLDKLFGHLKPQADE